MKAVTRLGLGAALGLWLLFSCSSEEAEKEPVPPPGPAGLSIIGFIGANGERYSREDAGDIRLDCTGLLGVRLEETNWLFRPPGNCGATPQCGHVAVSVDDVVIEASNRTVLFELGSDAAGTHRVHAELRLGDRSPFIGDDGSVVADELDVTVSIEPCPEAPVAGAGGTGGDGGGEAGALALGGTGGVGGSGGDGGNLGAAAGAAGSSDGGRGGSSSPGGAGGGDSSAGSGGV